MYLLRDIECQGIWTCLDNFHTLSLRKWYTENTSAYGYV